MSSSKNTVDHSHLVTVREDLFYEHQPDSFFFGLVPFIGVDLAAKFRIVSGSTSYRIYYLSFSKN